MKGRNQCIIKLVSILLLLVLLIVNSVSSILADEVYETGKDYTIPDPELAEETETQGEPVANSISGVLWLDENSDGILDEEETLVSNYPVYLYGEGDLAKEIEKVITDEEGKYEFTGLEAGNYIVGVKAEENETGFLLPVAEVTNNTTNKFTVDKLLNDTELLTEAYSAIIAIAEDSIVTDISCGMGQATEQTDSGEVVDSETDNADTNELQTEDPTEAEVEPDTNQNMVYSISPSDLAADTEGIPAPYSAGNTLDISWVSNTSNGTVTGSLLTNEPSDNTTQYATVQVNFQLADGASAAAGEVEIRIPYTIIEGDSLSDVSIAGADDFEWYYDETENVIVLTNKTAIDSSKKYIMQIIYEYLPSSVVADDDLNGASSSYIGSFDADLYISNAEVQSSNELNVEVTTKIVAGNNSKSFYQKDELWQSAWGTEPTDSSDYFYLIWRISYTTASNCTQSYTISIDDIIPAEYMTKGAYVVGYRYNSSTASFVSGDSYYTAIVDAPLSSYNPTYYWYVVIAYPRSLYLDENLTSLTITNTAETELAGEYDTTAKTDKTTAAYSYSTVNFSYSGDIYSISKSYYSSPLCRGLINALKDDQSVEIKSFPPAGYSFSIATTSRGYGETYGLLDTGEYGYGAKEYTTTLIDDLMYLEGEQLVAGDYSIDSFSMYTYGFIEYDAYENPSSGVLEGKASTDYTSYSPIEVWYQTGGDGSSWILLGTVTKKSNSSCTFTPKGGTAQALNSSNDQVALPSGCTGIKFVHSTNRYSVSYQPYITVSLHSTDHVKLLLAGKSSATLYNIDSLIVENADGNMVNSSMSSVVPGTLNSLVDQRDENIYGNKVQHQNSYYTLDEITAISYITKTSTTPANDGDNPQAKVTYTITAYDRAAANGQLSWEYIKSLGVIIPQNEGTFYDLLPAGAYADTSSIQVKTYALGSGSTTTCTVESIETVDNWQGSGQTMLIINVCYPDADYGDNYYSSGNLHYSGFTLTYDLYYPWDSLVDYGNSLINSVAYRAAEGELSQGKTAAESDITFKEYFANLTDSTGSSPNDDMDKNTIYKDLTTSVIVATSTNVGFSKKVNSEENSLYDKSTSVYIGDTYTYQLRYRTAEDANAKNIVFYDVLEENYGTNSYWKGTFAGIDTSYIASNYPDVDIQVYYSTVSGLDQYSASSPNLADTSIWSETPPADLSTVTAVAVDISKNKDNTDFELQINSTVLCYITMTAPSDYSAYLAYNYAKCYGSMFTTPGNESTFALPSDSNVSLLAKTNFEFTKVDAVDDQVLSDAEFALYEWTDTTSPSVTDLVNQSSPGSWSLVDTAASDGNGLVTFTDLTEGYYQLVEISAPTGYVTPSGQWRIEVDAIGAITFTAVKGSDGSAPPALSGAGTASSPYKLGNIIDYKLPEMGGIGTYIFRILGGVLLLIGLAVTVIDSFRKRKSRVRE